MKKNNNFEFLDDILKVGDKLDSGEISEHELDNELQKVEKIHESLENNF